MLGSPREVRVAASRMSISRAVAAAEHNAFVVRAISLADASAGVLELHGQDGSWLVRDRAAKVWVDAAKGEVLARQHVADLTPYQRWIDTADLLHFGSFAGLPLKGLWFLAGLGLSGLCISGARIATRDAEGASSVSLTRAAYAFTLTVLAAAGFAGVSEVRSYASDGAAWPSVPAVTVAILAVWLASTCAVVVWWMRRARAPRPLAREKLRPR
jgi:uncharacterized iron-regulated membrane protein